MGDSMYHLIVALFFVASVAQAASFGVGEKEYVMKDITRNRTLTVHVWYPVDPNEAVSAVTQKGNPFIPVVSARDAALVGAEKFPVVLLSHGSGGKADKLFWLTERLVREGMMVVAVDHQGNMTGDNSADGMMRVWNRPKDLTFALDQVASQPFFRDRLDMDKVVAAGHSAGGATVLLLAGAKLSASRLTSPIPTCAGTKDPYLAKVCGELKSIDMKQYPKEVVEADYHDRRVKAVVSLDPGFVKSFETTSLKKLKSKPLLFIADKMNTSHDQIMAKEFKRYLPKTAVRIVPDSYHMTFLQACRPDFPTEDPELAELCVENDRKIKIQKKVADASVEFFRANLTASPRTM